MDIGKTVCYGLNFLHFAANIRGVEHMSVFIPKHFLDHLLDRFLKILSLEPAVRPEGLSITKYFFGKFGVSVQSFAYRHSQPAQEQSDETTATRLVSIVVSLNIGRDMAKTDPPVLVPPIMSK